MWLWRMWNEYAGVVKSHAAEVGGNVISIFNGDVGDGDHHSTAQIITRNRATMLSMAVKTLDPLIAISDSIYVIRGTEAHSGTSAWFEEELARDIGAVPASEDVASHWHLKLEVNGVRLDIAHHGPGMGRLPHTRRNAGNKLAAMILSEWAERREPSSTLPHLAIRSHWHRRSDSWDNYAVRGIYLGAWQLKTSYVYKIAADSVADFGGIIVTCWPGGTYDVRSCYYTLPPQRYRKHE